MATYNLITQPRDGGGTVEIIPQQQALLASPSTLKWLDVVTRKVASTPRLARTESLHPDTWLNRCSCANCLRLFTRSFLLRFLGVTDDIKKISNCHLFLALVGGHSHESQESLWCIRSDISG